MVKNVPVLPIPALLNLFDYFLKNNFFFFFYKNMLLPAMNYYFFISIYYFNITLQNFLQNIFDGFLVIFIRYAMIWPTLPLF